MASFPLKTHIFLPPVHLTPDLKLFPLHRSLKFCAPEFHTHGYYSCKKFAFCELKLATIHPLQTDRQTDDNHA